MAPAMRNPRTGRQVRCRLHGGRATGPTTAEGSEKCRRANWKHGHRSRVYIQQQRRRRAELRRFLLEDRRALLEIKGMIRALKRTLKAQAEKQPTAPLVVPAEGWPS